MKRAYDLDAMTGMLIDHEGMRTKMYLDTKGIPTIGIGRNLQDRGITVAEARMLCQNDIEIAETELDRNMPWWRSLNSVRQMVLVDMCFNLGWPRYSRFVRFWAALKGRDFETAADEMLDSKWARQDVGAGRSGRLAAMMRTGEM